ncbi:unnamed protein product [Phaeothamnion confervicola]
MGGCTSRSRLEKELKDDSSRTVVTETISVPRRRPTRRPSRGHDDLRSLHVVFLSAMLGRDEAARVGALFFPPSSGDGGCSFDLEESSREVGHLSAKTPAERLTLCRAAYDVSGHRKIVKRRDMENVVRRAGLCCLALLEHVAMATQGPHRTKRMTLRRLQAFSSSSSRQYVAAVFQEFASGKDKEVMSAKEFKAWACSAPRLRFKLFEFSLEVSLNPFQALLF